MKLVASQTYQKMVEMLVAFALLAYPGLMIAVKGGMNAAFALLLVLSVCVLIFRPDSMPLVVRDKETAAYLAAMAALPVAIFLSQSYHQNYTAHPYDAASRFLLALPIFVLLRRVRFSVVAVVQYGFPLAAISGCLMSRHIAYGRFGIPTLDLIHFGDFELMLGVLSVLSINLSGRDTLAVRILKITGFIAGVYASIKTGSRGGWIALPVIALIYMRYRMGHLSLKTITVAFATLMAISLPLYIFNPPIHDRVNQVGYDLAEFRNGSPDTATGMRLQLYKAAVIIFLENPVFGVGPEGYKLEMDTMVQSGKITATAANMGKAEVHNELLSKTAGMGICGLIGILSIYLIPLALFYRSMCSGIARVKQSGMLGLVFVSGFMVFGLTVEILNLTMAAAFYGLTVAVLLAACLNVHHGAHNNPDTVSES